MTCRKSEGLRTPTGVFLVFVNMRILKLLPFGQWVFDKSPKFLIIKSLVGGAHLGDTRLLRILQLVAGALCEGASEPLPTSPKREEKCICAYYDTIRSIRRGIFC